VVLPAPLGPSRPRHVPAATSSDKPSTAVKSPNRFVASVIVSADDFGTRSD